MSKYTFFLEYQGDTYISQIQARTYKEAPGQWIEELDLISIPNLKNGFKEEIIKSLKEF